MIYHIPKELSSCCFPRSKHMIQCWTGQLAHDSFVVAKPSLKSTFTRLKRGDAEVSFVSYCSSKVMPEVFGPHLFGLYPPQPSPGHSPETIAGSRRSIYVSQWQDSFFKTIRFFLSRVDSLQGIETSRRFGERDSGGPLQFTSQRASAKGEPPVECQGNGAESSERARS